MDRPTDSRTSVASLTILLVEDEDAVRHVTERMLRQPGYTVISAADAVEARQVAEDVGHEIDVLVTDVILPGDGGPVLAEGLRARCRDLCVLYVSGYPKNFLAQHYSKDMCAEFLQKPFSQEQLLEKIAGLLAEDTSER